MLLEKVKILIVDDVTTMRFQVKELLRSFGFQIFHMAKSGLEAQAILTAEPMDLILCDWHMEGMDGFSLLQFVRSNPQLAKTPFILVTAESTKERVVEAIKAGVDDYLVKPLTIAQIQNKVYGVLLKKGIV